MSIDAATIAALTSAQPRVSQPVQVTVISTPDNQVPARIQGEVTQVKPNGEAVISTKSGEVTVKTEPLLVRGQRVDIKLPTQSLPNLPQNTLPQLPLNGQLTVVAQGKASLPIELPLTPPVLVTASSDQGNPQTTTNVALYNVPKIGASVQNVLQLLGLDLPASLQKASVLPPSLTQQSGQASQPTLSSGGAVPSGNPLTNTPLQALQNVQVSFIGDQSNTQSFLQTQSVIMPFLLSGQSTQIGQAQSVTIPALAKLIGFTSQKLPVFQIETMANLPKVSAEQSFIKQALSTVQIGDRVIIHQSVSSQKLALSTGESPLFALNIKVPIGQTQALQPNVQTVLSDVAPLLTQLIEEPESVLASAALSGQAASIIPRVGTPQFVTALIMNLLGFSKSDPAPMFGKRLMEALSDKQITTLKTEMQSLASLTRDPSASMPEGTRLQFPVEMNGQFFIWSLSYRSPYEDGRLSREDYQKIEKPTRFVLDFTMTRLGNFQVDGLSFYKSKRLDLIMRTDHALQPAIEQSFKARAIDVFESAGMNGQIDFQTL